MSPKYKYLSNILFDLGGYYFIVCYDDDLDDFILLLSITTHLLN